MTQMNPFNQMMFLINAWRADARVGSESFEEFLRRLAAAGDAGAGHLLAAGEFLKLRGSEDGSTPAEGNDEAAHQHLVEALDVAWAYSVDYSETEEELRQDHAHQARLRALFRIDPISEGDLVAAAAHVNRVTMAEEPVTKRIKWVKLDDGPKGSD